MRVLHIETGRHLYGGALQVAYLIKALAQRAVENVLVCTRDAAVAQKVTGNARIIQSPLRGDLDPRLFITLVKSIRRLRPQLVHIHSRRGADLWGPIAARLTGCSAIITRRVDNPEWAPWAGLKYRPYAKIVVISKAIERVLLARDVPAHRIVCIPSAIDCGRYDGGCQDAWFRAQFGYRPDQAVIGVIAQLIPRKGHRHLIAAMGDIIARHRQTRFIFLGQGPLAPSLKALCHREGVADHVIFAGFRPDIDRILPCLQLVVHPADMEGLGVALLESAAAGVPVVATKVGGIPEVVAHGQTGYLVPAADPKTIATRVNDLLDQPAIAAQMGAAGQRWARTRFSIDTMASAYHSLYDQIVRIR